MAKKRDQKRDLGESKRRRAARKRRANARNRQRAKAFEGLPEIPAPLATTRAFPKPINIGGTDVWISLFIQVGSNQDVWRHKMTRLVQDIKEASAVHTLLTYHAIIVLLEGTGAKAKDELRRLRGGPGDIDYWLGIGRRHLASRTAFDSEDEVKRWADAKWALLKLPRAPEFNEQSIFHETEAVRLLFRGYERAQLVLDALDNAVAMNDDNAATARLAEAYNHASTQMSEAEVLQISMLADVDPAILWPQHAEPYGPTFAFGRFVGRLDAGVMTVLQRNQFVVAKQIVESTEDRLSALWLALRRSIQRHFSIEKFGLAIHMAEQTGGVIEVSRATRELWVTRPPEARILITAVDGPPAG
jgi:hypothetical protein